MGKSEEEVKFEKYKSTDPYPHIAPALLNSADVADYARTTGMLEPFIESDLKSASYEAKIGGICKYWTDNGPQETDLSKPHDTFTLKPNSIAFVEVQPTFRLPDYMALRFNLKITHVYRGLLLGTGPLIDPGFEGKIFIPLHNLTSNAYTFEYGDGLIWVEFTKISANSRWDTANLEVEKSGNILRQGRYKEFNKAKTNMSLSYYLNKANKGKPIISSIPAAMAEANLEASKATREVKRIRNWGAVGVIGLLISFGGLMTNSWLVQRAFVDKTESHLSEDMSRMEQQVKEQFKLIAALKAELAETANEVNTLKEQSNEPLKLND